MNNYLNYGEEIYQLACELYKLKHLNRRKRTLDDWEYLLKKQVEYAELMFGYNELMYNLYKNSHKDITQEFKFQMNAAKNILLDYRDQYLDFKEKYKERD